MSVINKILAHNLPEVEKIIFHDFLQCNGSLFTVNKAVNAACKVLVEPLREQLELREINYCALTKTQAEKICNGEPLESVLARLHEAVARKSGTPAVTRHTGPLVALLERLQAIYASYESEQDAASKERMEERLVICLHQVNGQLDQVQEQFTAHQAIIQRYRAALAANAAAGLPEPEQILRVEENDEDGPAFIAARDTLITILMENSQATQALVLSRQETERQLTQFLAQENCARRFKAVVFAPGPQQDRALADTSAFSDVRQSQARQNMTRAQRAELQRLPNPFSVENFRAGERLVLEADLENDRWLQRLWPRMRQLMRGAPAADAPARVIRQWIGDPANAAELAMTPIPVTIRDAPVLPREIRHFQALTALHLTVGFRDDANTRLVDLPDELGELQNLEELVLDGHSFREIPPVIQRLPALRRLTIRNNEHPLRELPEWFGALRNLEELTLEGQDFPEIPPILERLPALHALSLRGNRQPIRVFPSWLGNKIQRGFVHGLGPMIVNEFGTQLQRLDRFVGLKIFGPASAWHEEAVEIRNAPYAGLPRENFTEIPFRAWFMENFSIPNVSLYAMAGIASWVHRLMNIETELQRLGWFGLIPALILPLLPAAAIIGLIAIAGPLPAITNPILFYLMSGFLISHVSFIPNAILYYAIEPLVESIRQELEEYGYGPNVRVPLLAAPQAPAAPAVPAPA